MVSEEFKQRLKLRKETELKAKKKESKRLNRLKGKPNVPKGLIDYKWCNVTNVIPKIRTVRTEDMKIIEQYANNRRVR